MASILYCIEGIDADRGMRYFTSMLINQSVTLETSRLDAIFAALADPTRRGILQRLCQGDATVNELAQPFNCSLPAISKHLKVLERAKLISRQSKAQTRPCHLEADQLKEVAKWLDVYRDLWGGSLDNLDSYLGTLQS